MYLSTDALLSRSPEKDRLHQGHEGGAEQHVGGDARGAVLEGGLRLQWLCYLGKEGALQPATGSWERLDSLAWFSVEQAEA